MESPGKAACQVWSPVDCVALTAHVAVKGGAAVKEQVVTVVEVARSVIVMVPVGGLVPVPMTVTPKLTLCPDPLAALSVICGAITCVKFGEVEPVKFGSVPLKVATIVWGPVVKVLVLQVDKPAALTERVPQPEMPAPSAMKNTVPLNPAPPEPGLVTVMVAVNVTEAAKSAGLPSEVTAIVVAALETTTLAGTADVTPWKFASST